MTEPPDLRTAVEAYSTLLLARTSERPKDGEYVCEVKWHRGVPLVLLKARVDD